MRKTELAAALAMLSACSLADPRAEAKQVADDYLKSISMYDARRPVSVKDEGSEWLVIYDVPKGYAGGTRWVYVDKRTMKMAGTVAGQ